MGWLQWRWFDCSLLFSLIVLCCVRIKRMQQISPLLISSIIRPASPGGFLDPLSIVEQLGIKDGMRVADFGSGGGYFAIYMAEKVGPSGKVYALDILEEKLDNLRSRARASGLENIETIRTNVEILGSSSLPDSSQDIVLLSNVLFQSQKQEDIIKEGVRVLKTGGEFIIIDWSKGTGGFGPPDELRLNQENIKALTEGLGLSFVRALDAGQFHFGLIFNKK